MKRLGLVNRARQRPWIWVLAALLFGLGWSRGAVGEQVEQLRPTGYVNDFAGVLSQSTRQRLEALLAELDRKADAQVAVVTVRTLGGVPIEDFSLALATRWKIGPKGSDRGVLILLAVDDHRYRIEVGYGLEGVLPDGKVGSFGRAAVPLLRAGDYDAAVSLLVTRIADEIAAERGVTLGHPMGREPMMGQPLVAPVWWWLLLMGIPLVWWLAWRLAGGLGRRGRRRRFGPWIGGVGWPSWGGGFGGGGGGGGFGGFGGGSFGGGGASGSW